MQDIKHIFKHINALHFRLPSNIGHLHLKKNLMYDMKNCVRPQSTFKELPNNFDTLHFHI